MRWNYLLPRLILVALVWAFFAFAFDPLLRYGLLTVGRRAVSNDVALAGVTTTLLNPSLQLSGARLAFPAGDQGHVVEFDDLQVRLARQPLLKKACVIEEGRLTGLRWQAAPVAPRKQGGGISGVELSGFDGLAHNARELARQWWEVLAQQAERQLDPQQLETVRVAQHKQADWQHRFNDWQTRAKQLEQKFQRIEDSIKARGNTLERLQAYQKSAAEIQDLMAESRRLREELDALAPAARRDFAEIDATRQRDLAALQQKLKLLRMDRETLTEMLLGPDLAARLAQAADWLRWIARAARMGEEFEPERGRGVDVAFQRDDPTPAFLIKKLHIDGTATTNGQTIPFSGTLTGLTTEPQVYGRPIIVQLAGEYGGRMHVLAELDHSGETAIHTLNVSFEVDQPTELRLGDPDKIVLNCAAEQSQWQARLSLAGEDLKGKLALKQDPFRVQAAGPGLQSPVQTGLVNAMLQTVRQFEASATIEGTLERPHWRLQSSLGDQLADGINAALADQLAHHREQLAAKVDAVTQQQSDEFRKLISGRYGELAGLLDVHDDRVRALVNNVASRSVDVRGLLRR